jgi:UDPglucose 6-dehydrogenase
MNIAIVGTGYVGLVTGACFAKVGHRVWCVDIDKEKIEGLKNGVIPIYEPGLSEIVKSCYEKKTLNFVTDLADCIEYVSVVFSAVGTPPNEDGSADLKYVLAVAKRFGELMAKGTSQNAVFVTKSTVPVGTAQIVKKTIGEELSKFGDAYIPLFPPSVASNPEFLKEGSAVHDFMKPDRIVVGTDDEWVKDIFKELYAPFIVDNPGRLIFTDIPSAEMIKYASNSMLATRISFMNEIANLCTKVGANIDSVRRGIGTDTRIGNKFLYAGCGYGGSCFPKDVKALIRTGEENGEEMALLKAVEDVNARQKTVPLVTLRKELDGFRGKTIAVWGLSFKPETDDVRESPSNVIIDSLCLEGAEVYAYDPVAGENFKKAMKARLSHLPAIYDMMSSHLHIMDTMFDVERIDGLMVITEWNEFRNIDWKFVQLKWPGCKAVFDGRNIYNRSDIENVGIEYYGIGR